MNPIERHIQRLRHDERGAILTELALSIPLFVILITGVVEAANYLLLNLKLQHTVVAISDLVTRDEDISEQVMADIFQAVPQIMSPYPAESSATTIVTAISQTEDIPPTVYWQRRSGTLTVTSDFGVEDDPADLPDGLTLRDDETILATEIYYAYEPLIYDFLPAATLRKVAYFRPRIGALQEMKD